MESKIVSKRSREESQSKEHNCCKNIFIDGGSTSKKTVCAAYTAHSCGTCAYIYCCQRKYLLNISHSNGLRELYAVRTGGTNGTNGMVHTLKTITTTRAHAVVKMKAIAFFQEHRWQTIFFLYFQVLTILFEKHRKNCECCPGHYLSTSVY